MAIFKVALHKLCAAADGYTWTNVYHIEALGPSDACSKGSAVADIEVALYTADTVIYKATAIPEAGGIGGELSFSKTGTRAGVFADLLPFFNTVRMSFSDGVKRPDQKYFRACLLEADIAGQNIGSDTLIDPLGTVAAALESYAFLRSSNGTTYTGHTVHRPVQMRQEGWNRRTRPGFKRGWVPV